MNIGFDKVGTKYRNGFEVGDIRALASSNNILF